MIGQNLAHYKVLEKLGSGGMGAANSAQTQLHSIFVLFLGLADLAPSRHVSL